MRTEKRSGFTKGKLFLPLMRFVAPVLFAMFLQTMYGAIDLLIVGQFGGDMAEVYVSAVSTGSQVMQTVTVVIIGLAMGLTVFVANQVGAGRRDKAGEIIGSGIFLFGCIALFVTVVMLALSAEAAQIMHAPAEAFEETVAYIAICSGGAAFIAAYNLIGSIFRGLGDARTPLVTVAAACVFNIAGDFLLVAVCRLGAAGAALATVAAQLLSVLFFFLLVRGRSLPFEFSMKYIRPHAGYMRQIMLLGTPIAFQDLLVSISFLAIIAIVNSLGLTASAGVGVAERICGFLMLVPSSFMQSISAFVAQNIGAGEYIRARRALLYGVAASLAVSVFTGYYTFFHGDVMAAVFTEEGAVITAAADYLRAYAIDCLLTSFLFCFVGYFNGCCQTTFVMVQGIVGAFGIRLPLSWLISRQEWADLFYIGLATPASSLAQIVLCGVFFLYLCKNGDEKLIVREQA